MAFTGGGDIGLDINVDIKTPYEVRSFNKSTRGADSWKDVGKGLRLEKISVDIQPELKVGVAMIADRVKEHMKNYAPEDSGNLKSKIRVYSNGGGRIQIGAVDVPYAVRRNYENYKNPQTKFYIENSWDNHMGEYQQILDNVAKGLGDRILSSVLRKTSGSKEILRDNFGNPMYKDFGTIEEILYKS